MPTNAKGFLDLPPIWTQLFMVLAYLQSRIWNPLGFDNVAVDRLGWFLIALGISLSVWSALHFRAHKTSIVPRNTPRSIITGGPYRFSRNPIYLSDAIMLIGVLLLVGTVIGFLFVPLLVTVINTRFIQAEEAGIKEQFPEQADAFFKNTRRWI